MEINNNFNSKEFYFDLDYLPEEEKVRFEWNVNLKIILNWWTEIILNFLDFSFQLDWSVYSFSPFHINFYFIDKYKIEQVYIPLFLKENYLKALEEKRLKEVKEAKEHIKFSYNVILNNYE